MSSQSENTSSLSGAILGKTVLVVDDVSSARKIVVRILNKLGFTSVKEASSLADAGKTIDETYLGIIITDVHLKDGKGFEILEYLKQKERFIATLFITSDLDRKSFEEALKHGQKVDYLLKPFSPDALAAKIRNLVS